MSPEDALDEERVVGMDCASETDRRVNPVGEGISTSRGIIAVFLELTSCLVCYLVSMIYVSLWLVDTENVVIGGGGRKGACCQLVAAETPSGGGGRMAGQLRSRATPRSRAAGAQLRLQVARDPHGTKACFRGQ